MTIDVVVVGGGPAGLAAACGTAEAGLATALIESMTFGGELVNVPIVRDAPGFEEGVEGPVLADRLLELAERTGVALEMDTVSGLVPGTDHVTVQGGAGSWKTALVVLALGATWTEPQAAGAERLRGRGVGECAICDAPLMRGRAVAVCGDGDLALGEVDHLAKHAAQVTLLTPGRMSRLGGWRKDVVARHNVRVLEGATVREVCGVEQVTGLLLDEAPTELPVDGVFFALGRVPATTAFRGLLDLDGNGAVRTDEQRGTSLDRVLAVGDCRAGSDRAVIGALADGTGAARVILGRREAGLA